MAETTKHSNYTGVNAFGVKANVEVLNTAARLSSLAAPKLTKEALLLYGLILTLSVRCLRTSILKISKLST